MIRTRTFLDALAVGSLMLSTAAIIFIAGAS